MRFRGLIFDFDGVLIESEYAGNKQIADYLTAIGHPASAQDSMANFMGLSGADFIDALERWIDRPLPPDFYDERAKEDKRAMDEGVGAVLGAIAFVRSLPPELPKAIASSSSMKWIEAHLDHLGLRSDFAPHIYSGREHVKRGKPAPDIYHYAANALGIPISDLAILEDSPVGATGAVASGAYVVGLCAGSHCGPDHADRLRAIGVDAIAMSFEEVAALLA